MVIPFSESIGFITKVGNKPEGTYLSWLDVTAVADKIDARKLASEENKKPQPISMLTNRAGATLVTRLMPIGLRYISPTV